MHDIYSIFIVEIKLFIKMYFINCRSIIITIFLILVTWMVFLILGAILLLIILVIVIFLRKRISIAIELIEEGSFAVGHMMSTLFFPIVPFIWQFLIIIWFVIVAVFLASSGQPEYRTDLQGGGIIYDKCK